MGCGPSGPLGKLKKMNEDRSKKSLSYLPRSYAGEPRCTKNRDAQQGTTDHGDDGNDDAVPVSTVDERPEKKDLPGPAALPDQTADAGPCCPGCAGAGSTCHGQIVYPLEPFGLSEPSLILPRQTPDYDLSGKKPVTVKVNLVGIRFGSAGKIYHFDTSGLELKKLDWVIVRTEKGTGLGQVIAGPFDAEVEPYQWDEIRRVVRRAERADFEQKARCRKREAEAYNYCVARIDAIGLPMKLVAVECYFDYTKYVFYFTAEGRIDFRDLVKFLVCRFPVRIEMRQIGVRHEAKMLGGIACCGQELCCSRYLTEFRPVSVKMAKKQNLSLNPNKISGVCGRLMCCLAYEHDTYEEFRREVPKEGKVINTVYGEAVILKHNPLEETITVRIGEDTMCDIRKDDIVSSDEVPTKTKEPTKKECPPYGSGHRTPRRRSGGKNPSLEGL